MFRLTHAFRPRFLAILPSAALGLLVLLVGGCHPNVEPNDQIANDWKKRLQSAPTSVEDDLGTSSLDRSASLDFASNSIELSDEFPANGALGGQPNTSRKTNDTSGVDVVVVCRHDWKPLLKDWIRHRQSQGHRIGWLDVPESPQALKVTLARHYEAGLKYVLLIGDIPEVSNGISDGEGIPTGAIVCEVSRRFGGPDFVASDNYYADFDGDQAPEIAVGRWAIDSEEQLKGLIRKTIRFETDPAWEAAKRRVEFVAGVGGFGVLQDKIIESTASRLLTDLLPEYHDVRMTHASWHSVYCPGPDAYQEKFFESLNRGALFWVYMGHGSPASLDTAVFPDRRVATINTRTTDRLNCQAAPIALLLACSTGQFANAQDCLAEQMVAAPAGPVAALGGTGVTAPYGLASFGFEMLSLYRQDQPKVLGDWLVAAKRRMLSVPPLAEVSETENSTTDVSAALATTENEGKGWKLSNNDYRNLLRQLAKLFSPTSDILHQELEEHVHMMTLFGDPLLRLPAYEPMEVEARVDSAGLVTISGQGPNLQNVPVDIELVYPLDQLPFRPQARPRYLDSAEFQEQLVETYERVNDRQILRTQSTMKDGKFSLELDSLTDLPRRVLVRACISHASCQALGICELLQDSSNTQEEEKPLTVKPADNPFRDTNAKNAPYQPDGLPIALFNQKDLQGWKKTNFGGEQEVYVTDDAQLMVETGYPMTGITFQGMPGLKAAQLPGENYELQLRVQKVDGGDFFAGLTFKVDDQPCSFIVGGWGGMTVGLSSIDGQDAARNATRSVHRFEAEKWYQIRVRVTEEKVQCWIDDQQVVEQDRAGHEFTVRNEVRLSMPLGFCNFQTTSLISHFQLQPLKKVTQENQKAP